MLDTLSNQYDSFLFWRQPIPELDLAELEILELGGGMPMKTASSNKKKEAHHFRDQENEDSLVKFTTFNYWRAPIASLSSLDLDLL
ncbi:protein AF1q [Polypterus senegalus]|nr:protein AF1q [Polypterus senegalus]